MSLDQDRRARLAAAKAEIRALMAPDREAAKIKRATARAKREKALIRSSGQRQPRVKDGAYLNWIRRLPCLICGARPAEAAHVRAGYATAGWAPTGMQQKPDDFRVTPLCAYHHRTGPDAQHSSNERAWWSRHGIDPPDLCRALRAAYDADQDGAAVLRRFQPARTA